MPRIAHRRCIRLYDTGSDGTAKVVAVDNDGNESILFVTESLSESKKAIVPYKEKHNLTQVRVETFPHIGYDKEAPRADQAPKLPVAKRFEITKNIIRMVLSGYINGVVLCGQGGCGKSYSVLEVLNDVGRPFKHVRGSLSPMELYKFLYDHRTAVVVFDDADAVFQTETSSNILKAVLDTTGPRVVVWYSGALEDEYPSEFCFQGSIVFISNRHIEQIPEPIQSRSMLLDLSFTREEIIDRMRELAPVMCPRLSEAQRKMLVDHIDENKWVFKNLSLRTLDKACKIVEAKLPDWKETVLFAG